MKDITTLVSTMNSNCNIIENLKVKDYVLINQKSIDNSIHKDSNDNLWINTTEQGLSKSRNMAIRNSNGYISVIADDDLIYNEGYGDVIYNSFQKHNDFDILIFQVNSTDGIFKKYSKNEKEIGFINSMKVSSVQIAFKTSSIREKVYFDERFGSGSEYFMGEENIFLFDCLRKGLRIKYLPIEIAKLKKGPSSWFKGYNEKYLISRGATYYRMSNIWFYPLVFQFAIRKKKLFVGMSFLEIVQAMKNGKKDYLRSLSKVG